MGTFQVKIPVTTKDVMLRPEEDTLAIMKWRLQHMNQENRWYPVIERYISYISARIDGLGGNSSLIKPSLNGVEGRSEARPEHARRYAGKISALLYGQFGDFEGFILQLQDGEHKFYSRERKIEEIANRAWEERIFVIIYTDADELHIPRLIELT